MMLSDITNKLIQIDNLWVQCKRHFKLNNDKDLIKYSKIEIEKYLKDLNIITNYGDTFRRYKIESVDFGITPSDKFPNP